MCINSHIKTATQSIGTKIAYPTKRTRAIRSEINMSPAANKDDAIPWSNLREDIGVIVWSSFLAACLASLLFFGMFDPLLLGDDLHPPRWLTSRMTGYALGFFFFWLICAVSASLVTFLIDTSHGHEPPAHKQERH